MARKLFATLEDYTGGPEDYTPVNDQLEVNEDNLEVEQQLKVLDEDQEILDNSVDTVNDLETVKELVENSDEPLSKVSATLIQESLNSFHARLGSINKKRLPSLESYNTKIETRKENTAVVLESISETISETIKKVKEFFIAMWKRFTEFLKYIFDAKHRLSVKITKLFNYFVKENKHLYIKDNITLKIPFIVTNKGVDTDTNNSAELLNSIDNGFYFFSENAKKIKEDLIDNAVDKQLKAMTVFLNNLKKTEATKHLEDTQKLAEGIDISIEDLTKELAVYDEDVQKILLKIKETNLNPLKNPLYKDKSGYYEIKSTQYSGISDSVVSDVKMYVTTLDKLTPFMDKKFISYSSNNDLNRQLDEFLRKNYNKETADKQALNLEKQTYKAIYLLVKTLNKVLSSQTLFVNFIYTNISFLYQVVSKLTTMLAPYTPDAKLLSNK